MATNLSYIHFNYFFIVAFSCFKQPPSKHTGNLVLIWSAAGGKLLLDATGGFL